MIEHPLYGGDPMARRREKQRFVFDPGVKARDIAHNFIDLSRADATREPRQCLADGPRISLFGFIRQLDQEFKNIFRANDIVLMSKMTNRQLVVFRRFS
jgi:hypothetical protein